RYIFIKIKFNVNENVINSLFMKEKTMKKLSRLFPGKHLAIHDYSNAPTSALILWSQPTAAFLQTGSVWQVR
ncbi:MAG: hypothetical protein D8M50_18485, partial [Candidatus Brocadia sp. AMX1]|nr:hypothetical protein [Candidatus Brocadia sp. AMX1]